MRPRPDEDEVCQGTAQFVASMYSGVPDDIQRPELHERIAKAVEMSFRVHEQRFVLEHTRIETAPARTSLFHALQSRFQPLAQALRGVLPTGGQFRLQLAHDANVQGRKRQREAADKVLLAWIREVAPQLLGRSRGRYDSPVERRPADIQIPFAVALAFLPLFAGVEGADGHLHVLIEDDRTALETWAMTIDDALNSKLPKLRSARRANDATSVFVAETRDVVHGPEQFAAKLGQALYRRSLTHDDVPDIALAVWRLPGHTLCWRVKVDGDWWHDNPDWGREPQEF